MSSWTDPSENPYASPLVEHQPVAELRPAPQFVGRRLLPMARTEVVLEGHTYEVGAVIGRWNLSEVYTVDGYVQTASATWWGWRRMTIGHSPPHAVDIYAWPTGGRELFVDGELVNPRAFPELRPRFLLGTLLLYGGVAAFLGVQLLPVVLVVLMALLDAL